MAEPTTTEKEIVSELSDIKKTLEETKAKGDAQIG